MTQSQEVGAVKRDRSAYLQQWRANRKAAMTDEDYARDAKRQREWQAANPDRVRAIAKRAYTKRWLRWLLAELRTEFSGKAAQS